MEFRNHKDIKSRTERDETGTLTQRFETRLTTAEEMHVIPAAMFQLACHAMTTEATVSLIDAHLLYSYLADQPSDPARIIMTPEKALRFARLLEHSGKLLMDIEDGSHAVIAARKIRDEATVRQHEQVVRSFDEQISSMSIEDFLVDPTQE